MSLPARPLLALALLGGLAACGDRDPPQAHPQPPVAAASAPAPAPDTSVMGAGRDTTAIEKVDDGSIVARLKAGFAQDPDISAMAIDVDSKGGMVTLSGVVTNSDAKVRADTMARSMRDVRSVNNQLEVKAG